MWVFARVLASGIAAAALAGSINAPKREHGFAGGGIIERRISYRIVIRWNGRHHITLSENPGGS